MSDQRPVTEPAVIPHLTVSDAKAAIEFYQQAFGAADLGAATTPDGKVMHAALDFNGSQIFLNDDFPEFCGGKESSPSALGGSPVTIHLYVPDADAAFQRAVDAGAEIVMPIGDQFWGDRYGIVKDPFGHQWSVAHHVREVSREELAEITKQFGSAPAEG
ncbi:MAG: VOC family protein [Segniliparus sp.]|uniref:VOC family protein n=1 Tax=Segniliparus sp. TaxID=2804064 RepID=UPI003F3D3CBB